MAANRSYYTDGTDDPNRDWLQKRVRVVGHPEWGIGRIMRWYPAAAGEPVRFRVMCEGIPAPQVVSITQVELLDDPD